MALSSFENQQIVRIRSVKKKIVLYCEEKIALGCSKLNPHRQCTHSYYVLIRFLKLENKTKPNIE